MVRLFQRVVRSLEVGLVVAARCVCVLRMVLRSVDLLRPRVASFSCTRDRASARMSAALSSTPRVGPILSLGQPGVARPRAAQTRAACDGGCVRRELWALSPRVHLHNCFGAAPRSQPLLPVLPNRRDPPPTTEPAKIAAGSRRRGAETVVPRM